MSSTRKASKARGSDNVNTHTYPILNDIPTVATSCLIYKYSTLQSYIGDSTYPIPTNDEFKSLRQLKSLQAVAKEISDGNVVFSHMFVNAGDLRQLVGEDIMEEMEDIQKDVRFEWFVILKIDPWKWRL